MVSLTDLLKLFDTTELQIGFVLLALMIFIFLYFFNKDGYGQ
jgi:hypothetical protein